MQILWEINFMKKNFKKAIVFMTCALVGGAALFCFSNEVKASRKKTSASFLMYSFKDIKRIVIIQKDQAIDAQKHHKSELQVRQPEHHKSEPR